MQDYIERELTDIAPEGSGLKVGDTVKWVNNYGVEFTNKIIGFNYTNEYNKKYNKFVHLDTGAYWFPHGAGEFKEDTDSFIYMHGLDIELINKEVISFSHFSQFDNPIFLRKADKNHKFTVLEDGIYTVGDEEPDCLAEASFQSRLFQTHRYNFSRSRLEPKDT